jgi:hypothetical protein
VTGTRSSLEGKMSHGRSDGECRGGSTRSIWWS